MPSSVVLLFRSLPSKEMPLILPSIAALGKFSSCALKKWLKCVNWYSASKRHPMQWQTESANFQEFKDVAMKEKLLVDSNAN